MNRSIAVVVLVPLLVVTPLVLAGCGDGGNKRSTGSRSDDIAWSRTRPEQLSADLKILFDRAERARKVLGKTLFSRVSEVIKTKGPARAIDVCNLEASGITDQVGRQFNVRIGRTSFRLRNPENTPPDWAKQLNLVQNRVDEQVVLTKGTDRLAVFTPIHLSKKCMACHGPKERIRDAVREALAQRYPRDEATGFTAGDLRGWFWVEVPRAGS